MIPIEEKLRKTEIQSIICLQTIDNQCWVKELNQKRASELSSATEKLQSKGMGVRQV